MPWIHLDDLCDIYIMAIENGQMEGSYNAVAPQHVTNKEFTQEIAHSLNKAFRLPNVPSSLMKILYGEMSDMLLYGSRVSSRKIERAGYVFRYPTLRESLKQING
jgi:NAD dependent epimerase/dehydratase family enzyme